jgi:hypothetical protein
MEPVGTMTIRAAPRKSWPDAFGINKYRSCVVSRRVLSDLAECGLQVEAKQVEFVWLEGGLGEGHVVPEFYYLIPRPGLELDLAAGGIVAAKRCPYCGAYREIEFQQGYGDAAYVPLPETWNGADIFTFTNLPGNRVCCSFRILELARKFKWKNFQFHPLRLKVEPGATLGPKGVDYMSRTNWPPKEAQSGH